MPFISVPWALPPSTISFIFVKIFKLKKKSSKEMLFPLSLKLEEPNPKASAGRKPCFYFHWKVLKAR